MPGNGIALHVGKEVGAQVIEKNQWMEAYRILGSSDSSHEYCFCSNLWQ